LGVGRAEGAWADLTVHKHTRAATDASMQLPCIQTTKAPNQAVGGGTPTSRPAEPPEQTSDARAMRLAHQGILEDAVSGKQSIEIQAAPTHLYASLTMRSMRW